MTTTTTTSIAMVVSSIQQTMRIQEAASKQANADQIRSDQIRSDQIGTIFWISVSGAFEEAHAHKGVTGVNGGGGWS